MPRLTRAPYNIQLSYRQHVVYDTLIEKGGSATTRQVAEITGATVGHVQRTLVSLRDRHALVSSDGQGDETMWAVEDWPR